MNSPNLRLGENSDTKLLPREEDERAARINKRFPQTDASDRPDRFRIEWLRRRESPVCPRGCATESERVQPQGARSPTEPGATRHNRAPTSPTSCDFSHHHRSTHSPTSIQVPSPTPEAKALDQ